MTQYRDDRLMLVAPVRDADPRRLARCRIAPVGGDEQWRVELTSVVERHHDPVIAPLDTGHARLPKDPAVLASFRGGLKRGPEVPVLVHPAEWLVVFRVEVQTARLKAVGNGDPTD